MKPKLTNTDTREMPDLSSLDKDRPMSLSTRDSFPDSMEAKPREVIRQKPNTKTPTTQIHDGALAGGQRKWRELIEKRQAELTEKEKKSTKKVRPEGALGIGREKELEKIKNKTLETKVTIPPELGEETIEVTKDDIENGSVELRVKLEKQITDEDLKIFHQSMAQTFKKIMAKYEGGESEAKFQWAFKDEDLLKKAGVTAWIEYGDKLKDINKETMERYTTMVVLLYTAEYRGAKSLDEALDFYHKYADDEGYLKPEAIKMLKEGAEEKPVEDWESDFNIDPTIHGKELSLEQLGDNARNTLFEKEKPVDLEERFSNKISPDNAPAENLIGIMEVGSENTGTKEQRHAIMAEITKLMRLKDKGIVSPKGVAQALEIISNQYNLVADKLSLEKVDREKVLQILRQDDIYGKFIPSDKDLNKAVQNLASKEEVGQDTVEIAPEDIIKELRKATEVPLENRISAITNLLRLSGYNKNNKIDSTKLAEILEEKPRVVEEGSGPIGSVQEVISELEKLGLVETGNSEDELTKETPTRTQVPKPV